MRKHLKELEDLYSALPVTVPPDRFVRGEGNWGLTEQESEQAKRLAEAIMRTRGKIRSLPAGRD